MTDPSNAPYGRDRQVDKPGIAGARWWHDSLADQASQIARREAIRNILIAGAVIAAFGGMLAMCVKAGASSPSSGTSGTSGAGGPLPEDYSSVRKTALEMQKAFGWSFGAVGEPLVFDGVTTKPFQPTALHSLATDLSPAQKNLKRYFQSTLFDSPDAVPTSLSKLEPEEAAGFRPLAESVQPIFTPAMDAAYARGKSLASLFASLSEKTGGSPSSAKAALVVDLDGPEAVAFAAGAASVFDAVFLFDNWPHPRGVVRAQETLSAAAYYQPLFAEVKRKLDSQAVRPAMFVLDRRRLTPYTDDATQFDNRYVAKLPLTAAEMRGLGADHVLYVQPPRSAQVELDDLNDELVVYAAGGVDVKSIQLDMFAPDAAAADAGAADAGAADAGPPSKPANESDRLVAESGFVYYGGSRGSHHAFFVDYPWAKPARPATSRPASNPGKSFVPVARATPYSSGSPDPKSPTRTKPVPTSFATVPVVVAVGTGIIVGSRYSRSGSWNRTSGSSWGGG